MYFMEIKPPTQHCSLLVPRYIKIYLHKKRIQSYRVYIGITVTQSIRILLENLFKYGISIVHFFHEEVFAMKNKFAMQMLLYIIVELKKLKSKSKNKEVFLQILKSIIQSKQMKLLFSLCHVHIGHILAGLEKEQETIHDYRVLKFLSNIFHPWRKELERQLTPKDGHFGNISCTTVDQQSKNLHSQCMHCYKQLKVICFSSHSLHYICFFFFFLLKLTSTGIGFVTFSGALFISVSATKDPAVTKKKDKLIRSKKLKDV